MALLEEHHTDADQKAKSFAREKERAEKLCRKFTSLENDRAPWDTQWRTIAEHFMPRKAQIQGGRQTPDNSLEANIYDTTGLDALQTMGAGLMSWTTPANETWFQLEPTLQLRRSDPVKRWLQECTHLMQEYLANSNYYTERHENLLNKCGFGTSAIYSELSPSGDLYFETQSIGSYCIEEDSRGNVTGFYRRYSFTAQQAVDRFGKDKLSKDVLDGLKEEQSGKPAKTFDFLYAIYPREEQDIPLNANRNAAIFMPFAACYVDMKAKTIVRESGYSSFPIQAARYLKWDAFGTISPWGYSPGFAALPDAKQINFLAAMLDVGVERSIDPPMLVPEEMEGEISFSARSLNYATTAVIQAGGPRELFKPMEVRYAQALLERKEKAINNKFHVELFKMFAQIERQMTAREVAERAGERLTLITPAFSRDVYEECSPLIRHVFALCAENGMLPPPPPEAAIAVNGARVIVPDPKVNFTGRLALAIKAQRTLAGDRTLERDMQIAQARPDILDNYDFDRMSRDGALANGIPEDWLVPEPQRDKNRQARVQAAAQQQQAMMAMEATKAAGGGQGISAIKEAIKA